MGIEFFNSLVISKISYGLSVYGSSLPQIYTQMLQGPRSGFLLVGLIEHRRCEISRGETFEIKSPEMPGNTSNFNNHHEVAYSLCLDFYIFDANICIEQKLLVGL